MTKKIYWKKAEDELLTLSVKNQPSEINWQLVSTTLIAHGYYKNKQQCLNRYFKKLEQSSKHDPQQRKVEFGRKQTPIRRIPGYWQQVENDSCQIQRQIAFVREKQVLQPMPQDPEKALETAENRLCS